jgi:hypothetical protein
VEILGALEISSKQTISFVMSVCLSVCVSAPAGRVCVKFDIREFFENLSRKFKFLKKSDNNGTSHEELFTVMTV